MREAVVAVPDHGHGMEVRFEYPEASRNNALADLAKKLIPKHGPKIPTEVLTVEAMQQLSMGVNEKEVFVLMQNAPGWSGPQHPAATDPTHGSPASRHPIAAAERAAVH